MRRATSDLHLLVLAAVAFVIGGCNETPLAPGSDTTPIVTNGDGSITSIRGQVFTLPLTDSNTLPLMTGESSTATLSAKLFSATPAETPERGELTLKSTDIVIEPVDTSVNQSGRTLPLDGTATVRFGFAPQSSTDPCNDVSTFARFDIVLTAGVPSVTNETAVLDAPTLKTIAGNDVTICMTATSDFDAQLTIRSVDLTFDGGESLPTLLLHNLSNEAISLIAPSEVFNQDSLLEPGESRIVTLETTTSSTITVRVGSNTRGTVATAECPLVSGKNYQATVEWTGTEFTCNADQNDEQTGDEVMDGEQIEVPIRDLNGDAIVASATNEFNNIDYAVVGVLDAVTELTPAPKNPSFLTINLEDLGIQTVETIHLATFSGWVPDLPNGTVMAELVLTFSDTLDDQRIPLTLGSNTAEWSHDRVEHTSNLGGVAHSKAPVLYTFESAVDSERMYTASVYGLSANIDSARTLTRISLVMSEEEALGTRRNGETRAWQSIPAITLVGPAGKPSEPDEATSGPIVPDPTVPEPAPIRRGTVSGIAVSAVTGQPVSGVRINITGTGFTATTDDTGTFAFDRVVVGDYNINASLTGFAAPSFGITVREDQDTSTRFELFAAGMVTGVVVNAQTGEKLGGTQLSIEGFDQSTTSGSDGRFTIFTAPEGERTLVANRAGFVEATVPVTVVAEGSTETSIGLLAEGAGGDGIAVILTWGEEPADLDLHVSGPNGSGERFHIAFFDLRPVSHASLDLDDLVSFGPETVTVSKTAGEVFVTGDYRVWIHNFSNTPEFDISSAIVTIFAKGEQIGQYRIEDVAGDATQDIWRVVDFTVAADGSVSALNVVNTFVEGTAQSEF